MIRNKDRKIAVVYFSLGGNTEYVVQRILEAIGDETAVDVVRLEPIKHYADAGPMKYIKGGAAASLGSRPQLKPYSFDPKKYDAVIVGSPIWAGTIAPPIRTFLLANKIKGKKIGVALCSSSGRADKCFSRIEKYLKKTEIISKLSLVDPAKNKNGGDLYEIRRFVREIMEARG